MEAANTNSALSSLPTEPQEIEMTSIQSASSSEVQPQPHVVVINPLRSPSLQLLQNKREYLDKCVRLYKLALKGDWNAARRMIEDDRRLLNAAITMRERGTLLHVAAGAKHVHFVDELVKLLSPQDLELQDGNENTPFCFAAASGSLKIAAIMMRKNDCLPLIKGGENMTPLYMAALQGRSDMVRYLYFQTRTVDIFEEDDWNFLFFLSIHTGLYDVALDMLHKQPRLALARNEHNKTGLHLLARNPSVSSCQGPWYLQNPIINSSMKSAPFIELVGRLWSMLQDQDYTEIQMRTFISHPSQILFDATEVGNFHFVYELMRTYPDLIWEMDSKRRSIIHTAVRHRHASIFNLIHEQGYFKDFIATVEDDKGNTILHYAAKLTPSNKLSIISGPALQMTHELLWFEEVKKLMLPLDIEKRNSRGKTPGELFVEKHKELLKKAESWTNKTAKNCMLVSTLIATAVFTATFTIPGGNNRSTGTPNYLQNPAFLIFAVSVAFALISSSASILSFLSIHISSYAEEGYFKSLPFKLLFGLVAQIISITWMMVAFSVAFFITFSRESHESMWVPMIISVLSLLPIPLFTSLLSLLWSDIIHSCYICISLFRP